MTILEMEQIPVLHSENYRLRGLRLEDADILLEIMSDRETMKYITPHPVQTMAEMVKQVQVYLERYHAQKEIPYVITTKEGKVIGLFRFHKLDLWHRKTEMGVVIHKDFQGKGVMTELLPIILSFGFENLDLNRIVGDIFANNTGSRKLLHKFGFEKDGIMRETDFDGEKYHDTIVYSMLKREYEGKKNFYHTSMK